MLAKSSYESIRALRAAKWLLLNNLSTLFFRFVCKKFGEKSQVGWGSWISYPWLVEIGDDVLIGRGVVIGTEDCEANLIIRDGVQINSNVLLDFTGGVEIKENALISDDVKIYSHSHGKNPREQPKGHAKIIGANAWIGVNAIIMHTCEAIGERAIVGAGTIATVSLTDGEVVVSAPNRRIA